MSREGGIVVVFRIFMIRGSLFLPTVTWAKSRVWGKRQGTEVSPGEEVSCL